MATADARTVTDAQAWRAARAGIVLAALALLLTRPLDRWWLAADCDASYTASALNLLAGLPTEKLDHPGMPLQTALTASLMIDQSIRRLIEGCDVPLYVDLAFHDPGRVHAIVKAWAIGFFIFGALTVGEVVRRLTGSAVAGLAAAALFAACPGSLTHATSFRPENLLCGLLLIVAYQLTRALRERSLARLVCAAGVLGFAATVKVHALGVVPVLAWTVWRAGAWADVHGAWSEARRFVSAHRGTLALIVAAAALLAARMNVGRPWWEIDARVIVVFGAAAGAAALLTAARVRRDGAGRTARRFTVVALSGTAALCGMLLPNAAFLDQLTPMLRATWYTISGVESRGPLHPAGVAAGMIRQWSSPSLYAALPIVALALFGAAWRCRVRATETAIFGFGAAGLFLLAGLRGAVHPSPHHYGPALALAIPLMLRGAEGAAALAAAFAARVARGLRNPRTAGGATAATGPGALLVGLIASAWPAMIHERAARGEEARCAAIEALSARCAADLAPDEVIVCDFWAQDADAAYFMLARDLSRYTPERDYRALPDAPPALAYAASHGFRPAYLLGSGPPRTVESTDETGRMTARSIWGHSRRVSRIVSCDVGGLALTAYRIEADEDAD
ncbi:MAG: hypothetical protein FLDDKLPJ_02608 [Phycisphaerae bacterium]|nr:hypothetical protein [Phycisphaerae bacterium]